VNPSSAASVDSLQEEPNLHVGPKANEQLDQPMPFVQCGKKDGEEVSYSSMGSASSSKGKLTD